MVPGTLLCVVMSLHKKWQMKNEKSAEIFGSYWKSSYICSTKVSEKSDMAKS
jgi:hypothetical protein